MKIAIFKNPANIGWRLAEGFRALGHEATVYARPDKYDFPRDVTMPEGPEWNLWLANMVSKLMPYDIIHIAGGIWRGEVAWKALSPFLPPIFIQYNGGEARNGGGLHWQSVASGFFYVDPDIRPLVPDSAKWLPQPIDTALMARTPSTRNGGREPVFGHFPTGSKGTEEIIDRFVKAFGQKSMDAGRQNLIVRGNGATLRVFYNLPHGRILDLVANDVDVVIDQITSLGIFGYISVEAMALGKPTLSTIDRSFYPADCPVIYPSVLKLMELARDKSYRAWLGQRGREYVTRVHNSHIIATRTIEAYKND